MKKGPFWAKNESDNLTDEPENSGETESDIDAETVAEEASETPTEEGAGGDDGGAGDEPPMPPEDEGDVAPISIEEEMKTSYLDYAMSVIVSRALPDVRDGLKPVHRRILFSMNENGYEYNKPYRKSARVVGDVIGKYPPAW